MNRAGKSYLIPVRELLPAEITRIRRETIDRVVAMACTELKKSPSEMVVRDIRPYSDIGWITDATGFSAAISTDTWVATLDSSDFGYTAYRSVITSTSQTMADSRWVAITGVRDFRLAMSTPVLMLMNYMKILVGGNERVIWDLTGMEAYPNAVAAISPSPVVIPQNTSFDIQFLHGVADNDNTAAQDKVLYLVIDGFVVEPRGKVISP